MEKTKLVIINNETIEEGPVVTASGYLAKYRDFEVLSIALDDLLAVPDEPKREHVATYETKTLREIRERISVGGLVAGQAFAQKNPHPR